VITLIRLVGIVLVIWGLIFQPLMAGMPTNMANDRTVIEVALDSGVANHIGESLSHHEHSIQTAKSLQYHHQVSDNESPTENCDNCDIDCLDTGMCASSCIFGGAGLNLVLNFQLDRQNVMPFSEIPENHHSGIPSYIYNPPRFF